MSINICGKQVSLNATRLDLSYNQLTSVPAELSCLTNLQGLTFDYNQLTSVPAELSCLTNLQSLNLHTNQLASVPAELSFLTNLQSLNLRTNQLTSVPAELSCLTNLQRLDLNTNQLTSVPAELSCLTNLKELYLNTNQLTSVPAELSCLTNLQWLYLDNNPIQSVHSTLIADDDLRQKADIHGMVHGPMQSLKLVCGDATTTVQLLALSEENVAWQFVVADTRDIHDKLRTTAAQVATANTESSPQQMASSLLRDLAAGSRLVELFDFEEGLPFSDNELIDRLHTLYAIETIPQRSSCTDAVIDEVRPVREQVEYIDSLQQFCEQKLLASKSLQKASEGISSLVETATSQVLEKANKPRRLLRDKRESPVMQLQKQSLSLHEQHRTLKAEEEELASKLQAVRDRLKTTESEMNIADGKLKEAVKVAETLRTNAAKYDKELEKLTHDITQFKELVNSNLSTLVTKNEELHTRAETEMAAAKQSLPELAESAINALNALIETHKSTIPAIEEEIASVRRQIPPKATAGLKARAERKEAELLQLQQELTTVTTELESMTREREYIESLGIQAVKSTTAAPSTSAVDDTDDKHLCKVCLDAPKEFVFTPCGHLCICGKCLSRLTQNKPDNELPPCPMCRTVPQQIVKTFD